MQNKKPSVERVWIFSGTAQYTSVKEVEKLKRMYKDLEIEIVKIWNIKASAIPVVIGALGLINKGLEGVAPLYQDIHCIKIHQVENCLYLTKSNIYHFKGAVSSIFSVTMNSPKMYLFQ